MLKNWGTVDNAMDKIFDNNFRSIMLDFTAGNRIELFSNQIAGLFRPVIILQTGGLCNINSFTEDNIVGIWMIKYILGLGIQFYNGRILNEITLKFNHSEAINGHAAFQLSFYWK